MLTDQCLFELCHCSLTSVARVLVLIADMLQVWNNADALNQVLTNTPSQVIISWYQVRSPPCLRRLWTRLSVLLFILLFYALPDVPGGVLGLRFGQSLWRPDVVPAL